jgi:hypothetical protein
MNKNPTNKKGCGSLLNQDERSCCKDEIPENGQPHECIETWKANVKIAANAAKVSLAKKDKAEAINDNASAWEAKLKSWIDNAEVAHEKALKVFDKLRRILFVVARLQTNTANTTKALEAVLCLVKMIFDEIVKVLRVSTSADDKMGLLQALKRVIECNEGLDEQKKQHALNCIKDYETQVQKIYALQASVLQKLLEILEAAEIVAGYIGSPGADPDFALKWQVEDLRNRIVGETTSKAKHHSCTCPSPPEKPTEVDPPCGKEISEPSSPVLPIRAMSEPQRPDNAYYAHLKELYETAMEDTKKYSEEMNKAQREYDKDAARQKSLSDAITAAEAAESAK